MDATDAGHMIIPRSHHHSPSSVSSLASSSSSRVSSSLSFLIFSGSFLPLSNSLTVFAPLLRLHWRQDAAPFSAEVGPPREYGSLWSSSKDSGYPGCGFVTVPQYSHRISPFSSVAPSIILPLSPAPNLRDSTTVPPVTVVWSLSSSSLVIRSTALSSNDAVAPASVPFRLISPSFQ